MITGEQPLVTAIITTRQRPHLVSRAIQSALTQTYHNLQILVVLDGPDPETTSLLRSMDEPRLEILELTDNVGASESRNVGVRVARGEWVAFLDDDDEWFPEKTLLQMEAALSEMQTNFVHSRFEEHTGNEVRVRPDSFPRKGEHWSNYFYNRAGLLIPSVFLVKRSLLLHLPFTKELRRHVDVDWLLRARAANILRPIWISNVLTIYHTEIKKERISTQVDWEGRHEWLIRNLSLVTRESIPYYIAMFCIPEAKRSEAPVRNCAFLLRQALKLGRMDLRATAYLMIAILSEADFRAKLRRRYPLLRAARVQERLWFGST